MNFLRLTLRTRIYLSMLAIILLSFLVSGGIAIYDHSKQTEAYNMEQLYRKEDAIKKSMEHFLNAHGGEIGRDTLALAFTDKICELSEVHEMFIGLYDLSGNYLISSNSMVMDSLGIPYKLNFSTLDQLTGGTEKAVIDSLLQHKDRTLAYWYFTDILGRPLAITNVAYVKDESNKDLNSFLQELGQSYILLFLVAAIVAYLLSTYITRSLQYVGQRMQMVQVGKKNEKLDWDGQDEIGSLVKEYNRMLTEMERSADLLAREERESAWREMAKQVAHEIKNPLTPMKLRVQYLQRAWMDKAPDFDEKMKAFAQSMSEQIDTLTRIANEFSNFAKMPRPVLEKVDLVQLTKSVKELYADEERIDIRFGMAGMSEAVVIADREQTIRALNNLITNAIQAIPSDRRGTIHIMVRCHKGFWVVRVSDNGSGISDAQKSRIFVPNFTTKTTGTGLGLAMVKNIMNIVGGGVWFWSKEGKGASFYLAFPCHQA